MLSSLGPRSAGRRITGRAALLVALLTAGLVSATPATSAPTIPVTTTKPASTGSGLPALVILVRHAEKAAKPESDPPLTKAGKERAKALIDVLKDAKVTAIVTSDAQRTRDTAEPLAEALGLKPRVVPLGHAGAKAHAEAVVEELRRQAGGVVVVIDHSDAIPAIIAALGGPRIGEISSKEYANLLLLTPGPSGARLVRARYGAPDGGS